MTKPDLSWQDDLIWPLIDYQPAHWTRRLKMTSLHSNIGVVLFRMPNVKFKICRLDRDMDK